MAIQKLGMIGAGTMGDDISPRFCAAGENQ